MTNEINARLAILIDLRDAATDAAERAALDTAIAALRAQIAPAAPGETHGTANTGDNYGQNIGVNLGIAIFGRDPKEDERQRIVRYLDVLVNTLYRLPLQGVATKLEREGDGVALPAVYTLLATTRHDVVVTDTLSALQHYFTDERLSGSVLPLLKPDYDPAYALPDQARYVQVDELPHERKKASSARIQLAQARLVTDAVRQSRRLVLLGDPGSGKSTFARYLCWALAQRELERLPATDAKPFAAWAGTYLPVMVSLRTLAAQLADDGITVNTVQAAVLAAMQQMKAQPMHDVLDEALHKGVALVCFDGLDEVPTHATDAVVNRETTLHALKAFGEAYPTTTLLVTCRVRAFGPELQPILGWPVETLAPFTMGQMRHFVPAWYRELVAKGQLTAAQATSYEQELIAALTLSRVDAPKLRAMAETPLLLTLMAWVLCDAGRLPRDRPELYEKILDLLLEQWDAVRRQQSIADVIGADGWNSKRMLPLLDRLSYEAHRDRTSADGRGRIAAVQLQHAVQHHLIDGGMRDDLAAAAAVRCLQHFDYRSGLLRPDADDYVFAHLTLQEHCAGRHIALNSEDPIGLIMQHRHDDRWREPIFLGMGLADSLYLNELLHELVDRDEAEQPKPIERWYRDLILAAELGKDRDWSYLQTQPRVKVARLQAALRTGLVTLLNDATQPLPVNERVRAGFLLGDLGDPRFPVTIAEWKHEAEKALAGDPSGYFCRVDAGTYRIGSGADDPDAKNNEKPQHSVTFAEPFWIARLPVTNAQWQTWVQAGGRPSYRADDSDLNHPNQPVVGVEWYWCRDFCRWLRTQTGLTFRLPSEAEWEAAARGGTKWRYPWGNDWRDDQAATEEDQETRGTRWSTPVGCYPRGAAPTGALDMAGNVWEWTQTPWSENHDPPRSMECADDAKFFTLKGGYYNSGSTYVRCGARFRTHPDYWYPNLGFRVVVSPSLAQMS